MENKENVFKELNNISVNEKTEKKGRLSYLSWAWAWAEVKKKYPNAKYTIFKDENNKPYIYDDNLGYMCFTTVTIKNETLEMWLPVMDGANKAMKKASYTYKTRYEEKTCESATMFDINKTIMRCLVKNLAMFGMALYIYAGEDLPEDFTPEPPKEKEKPKAIVKPKATKENIDKAIVLKATMTQIEDKYIVSEELKEYYKKQMEYK